MNARLRALLRPEGAEHPASPSPGEAFGGWMLGTLCVLVCLWLGDLGTHSLVPGVLVGGVLALWGWRHIEWLLWLPPVLVLAMLIEPLSPLALRGRFGSLAYVDVLMIGVTVVAVVRAVALRRPIVPRTPLDRLVLGIVAMCGLWALGSLRQPNALGPLKQAVMSVGVFYATSAVAGRPGGSRWVWPAFPIAAGLVGLHAAVTVLTGREALAAQARAADTIWSAENGLFNLLLCSVPACLGLSVDAGHRGARRVWRAAAVCGAAGLAAHLAWGGVLDRLRGWRRFEDPLQFSMIALSMVAIMTFGRLAWGLGRTRPHERPRWFAVACLFFALPLLQLGTDVLFCPASTLIIAIGGGLVVGACLADGQAFGRDGLEWREAA